MKIASYAFIAVAIAAIAQSQAAQSWPQYGGNPQRHPVAAQGVAPRLAQPRWVNDDDPYLPDATTPVVYNGRVYVYAYDPARLVAFAVSDGELLWEVLLENPVLGPGFTDDPESRATPGVHPESGSIVIASGRTIHCVELITGAVLWETPIGVSLVNSSVLIVENRAFVTGYGSNGSIYALSLDASIDTPGKLLWSAPVGGATVGNPPVWAPASDPADNGQVISGTRSGIIRSFDPENGDINWTIQVPDLYQHNSNPEGFTGGFAVYDGNLYASTYNFYGIAHTVKIDIATQEIIWQRNSERSSSTPIVTDDLVLVSGGLYGFGSNYCLEALCPETGDLLWKVTGIGGWQHTPVVVGNVCFVGEPLAVNVDPSRPWLIEWIYTELHALDLSLTPSDPGFIIETFEGAGGTPAFDGSGLYSVGLDGLHAFGWAVKGDVNGDCVVNILDLIAVRNRLGQQVTGTDWQEDVNDDGVIDAFDLMIVRSNLGRKCIE